MKRYTWFSFAMQAFTDIDCVLGGGQDVRGNTDDADRVTAFEQLIVLRRDTCTDNLNHHLD